MSYRADNTSVIVVMIYPPGPSKSEVSRTPSIQSTCSTLKLTSESDNEEASGSDVSGSDCDIDLDQGDADDLSLPCNVGKIFPSLDPSSSSLHAKKTVARNLTEHCVRNIIRPLPASQGLSSTLCQKHHMHQVKMRKLGRCNTTQSESMMSASHKSNSSANGNILMEAALNAPPLFKEPTVTKVTPTKLLHKSHPGQSSDSEESPEMTTLRALRSRSPKHTGENMPSDGTTLTLGGRPRYSLSPSSSFMSNEISPLEATSARSPLKVDTSLKSGLLPMASVSPLWPNSLETGGRSETDPVPCLADLNNPIPEDQKLCHSAGSDLLVEGHEEDLPGCSENVENPIKSMPGYRTTVKRRASQSPKTVSTKRAHQSLSQQRLNRTRSHSAHPITRAHVKSPPKKAKS